MVQVGRERFGRTWLSTYQYYEEYNKSYLSTITLDEEVRLYATNAERERYSLLPVAMLFGIIVALDYLERAYVRAALTAAE